MSTLLKWIGIALAVVILLGPILGPVFMATKTTATSDIPGVFLSSISLDCGSVFNPKSRPVVTDAVSWDTSTYQDTPQLRAHFKADCDSAINSRKGVSIAVIVLGGLIWIAAAVLCIRTKTNPVTVLRQWRAQRAQPVQPS